MRDALHGHPETSGRKLSKKWVDSVATPTGDVQGTAAHGELPRGGMDHQLEKLMRS